MNGKLERNYFKNNFLNLKNDLFDFYSNKIDLVYIWENKSNPINDKLFNQINEDPKSSRGIYFFEIKKKQT